MASSVVSSQLTTNSESVCTNERSFPVTIDDESFSTVGEIFALNSSMTSQSTMQESPVLTQSEGISSDSIPIAMATPISPASVQSSGGQMSSYTPDTVLDKEWFRREKSKIEEKLLAVQKLKKQRMQDEKSAAVKLERTLPMDLLAFDWFNENALTSELRVYLIDKLLPTLILGMEKVLLEAEKRGLIESDELDEGRRKFNPINLLAQYLMRNNPRYCNFAEASPYIRGLWKVSEELKRDVYQTEANKLAKLKVEARKKRDEQENIQRRKEEEKAERARLLKLQFSNWLVESGRLQMQLIQNALYSYLEISSHLASDSENVVHYSKELEATDETGITLTVDEYTKYVEGYVHEMSMPEFKQLVHHLDQCAYAFRRTFEREVWRDMFMKLFGSLDTESSGYLDRHRMLHLLEKFWDKLEDEVKGTFHNPRKWPVIELEELDDLYPDSEDESDETVNVSTEEVGSSEWASVPMSTFSDAPPPDEDHDHEDEDKMKVEESRTPGSDENERGSEKDVKEEDEEVAPDAEDRAQAMRSATASSKMTAEDDQTSTKVSSAAGDDAALAPDETAPVEEGTPQEEVKDEAQGETEEEDAVEPSQDVPVKSTKDVAKEKEDQKSEEKVETLELSSQIVEEEKTEKDVEVDEEKLKVDEETQKEPTGSSENAEVEKKEESESAPTESSKLFTTASGLAATLITPAPSTDESTDVGPVNVQFSKEPPRPQVRKTTSVTTVQRKKAEVEVERTWGHDPVLAQVEPVEAERREVADVERMAKADAATEKDSETVITTLAEGSEQVLVQHTADDMRVDDYRPLPVEVKTRPASASRMSVTFAAEPLLLPDCPSAEFFSHYSSRSQSRLTSVFDESQLNESRFMSLLENFLCDDTMHNVVEQLVNFIHGGYVETEEEKLSRLARARREMLSAKHRQMVDSLFNKWDNDGQGHIDNEEVDDILSKYKGGMENSALKKGKQAVRQARKHAPYHDRRRLNRKEFHVYVNAICDAMSGGEEVFDGLVEYATSTVERTYAERVRGDARRKWLQQIQSAAETGGASMDSVYRSVFQTLYKDADSHGNQKKISSYIALLEHNILHPHRGAVLLRYVACTPDNAPFMLGKAFYEDMRGISFYAVRRGKLVHVPRVQSHGRVYFWNPDRDEGVKEGSLVLVPLRDEQRRTYGLIGIDNIDISASSDRSIFASHEINFFQGIAKTFSNSFHHVDLRRKLLRIIDAAMSWVHSRAPRVRTIIIYFVEPDPKSQVGHVLRKMMTADNNTGVTITHARPLRLYRKDNLFRDYLFKCMENSETTSADAYGQRHTAYPLRDDQGRCQCVVDISIGSLRALPRHEMREVQRMLKLLQAANREVMRESQSGEKTVVLEAEERGSDDTRVDIMFDRLMLTDLRENVSKLDTKVFAELKNYKVPPPMIHNILKAVLMLFHHDEEEHKELEDWVNCKQMVTGRLRQRILTYDPTAESESGSDDKETDCVVKSVGGLLKGIAHGAVARHGSRPAQQLYNWAFVCLSLIEHARKMRQSDGQPAVTPVTSASTNTTAESATEPQDDDN
ncbi:EF-hand calcium-binding domain-containing protein 5-like isoform X3 [Clavelina lepadiformis]|uniref:EF-hand domain-containing protein n=1 Tax=Clavelina lepadiformis TaxID=159417 RepID=A0ABP0G154_CLALP